MRGGGGQRAFTLSQGSSQLRTMHIRPAGEEPPRLTAGHSRGSVPRLLGLMPHRESFDYRMQAATRAASTPHPA